MTANTVTQAKDIEAEARDLEEARRQWLLNGRALQRTVATYQRIGRPVPPAVAREHHEWQKQGLYLRKIGQQIQGTELGFLPLLIWGGVAAATVIGGIFTAKKAIDVQEKNAERQAEIVRMVTEGEITPEQGTALQTAKATGGESVFKKLFGISPLILLLGATAVVFGKDLFRKVFK